MFAPFKTNIYSKIFLFWATVAEKWVIWRPELRYKSVYSCGKPVEIFSLSLFLALRKLNLFLSSLNFSFEYWSNLSLLFKSYSPWNNQKTYGVDSNVDSTWESITKKPVLRHNCLSGVFIQEQLNIEVYIWSFDTIHRVHVSFFLS